MNIQKTLLAGTSLIKNKLFGKRVPLSVNIALNNKCNFHCAYCDIPTRKQKEMSTKQIFQLVNELKEVGCARIGLTGGEPMLRKDIEDIVNYIKSKGIITSLVSNGFITAKNIGKLKNLDFLALSFDGPRKIHDKNRTKGSYNRLIETIKAAKRNNLSVWTVTVINKDNVRYLNYIVDKAEELGFSCFFQPVFQYPMSGPKVKHIEPSKREFIKGINKLIEYKKQGRPVNTSFSCLNFFLNYPKFKPNYNCYAGELFLYIDVNGDIYSCFGMIDAIKPPNFLKEGLALNKVKKLSCPGCWCHTYVELNYMFKLNFKSIKNTLKVVKDV